MPDALELPMGKGGPRRRRRKDQQAPDGLQIAPHIPEMPLQQSQATSLPGGHPLRRRRALTSSIEDGAMQVRRRLVLDTDRPGQGQRQCGSA